MSVMLAEAPATTGEFTGYAATWTHQGGADRQGDVIRPGAFSAWVKEINSGRVVPIVAGGDSGHSDAPLAIVGHVLEAQQDQTGLWIRASLTPDADAQALRLKMRAGSLAALSIGYVPGMVRQVTLADGTPARQLDQVDVHHIALTGVPANPSARIASVKSGSAAVIMTPVVTVKQDIAMESARRNPERAAEDQLLAAVSWPPPGLFDRATSLALIRGAAEAKAASLPADHGEAMLQARRNFDNEYSYGLARWMAAHR